MKASNIATNTIHYKFHNHEAHTHHLDTPFSSLTACQSKTFPCLSQHSNMNMPIINFTLINNVPLLSTLIITSLLLCFYMIKRTSCRVYLIDFACYKPPDTQMCTKEYMIKKAKHSGYFSEETLDFMKKVFGKSGLGDSTYLSEVYLKQVPDMCMKESRREMEMSVFGSMDMLLKKTGVRCEDIGILVVNCCIYNTMPSLSSMIVNKYKLRDGVISYNLVGMGCSAGLMAIGLAEQLLQVSCTLIKRTV